MVSMSLKGFAGDSFCHSLISAVALRPFMQMTLPPGAQNDSARLRNRLIEAKARLVNIGVALYQSASLALSFSRRVSWIETPFNPRVRITCRIKVVRFWRGSTSVTCSSGQAILRTRPGKPAPLPTSIKPGGGQTLTRGSRVSESRKWVSIRVSNGAFATRLIRLFHFCSSVR